MHPLIQRSSIIIVLIVLAGHFLVVQYLTGVQFGDAPRNLHWGILIWDNPAFLVGAPDTYERIKGFAPDPESLSEHGLWANGYSSFHRWWGPVVPSLFALTWGASHSYLLIKLVIPVLAGATVLLLFVEARRINGLTYALIASAFLSSYPLFREYGTMAYSETFGALILLGAFSAYLRGHLLLTVLLGAIAALTKMDIVAMYSFTIGGTMMYDRFFGQKQRSWRYHLIALFGPLLITSPWIWLHYLNSGTRAPSGGLSLRIFGQIVPTMLELLFYMPWYASVGLLSLIGLIIGYGIFTRSLPALTTMLLGAWLGCGLLISLIYMATPGASNSPRIFIPALPALAMLVAAGMIRLPRRIGIGLGSTIGAIFLAINLLLINFQAERMYREVYSAQPAFAMLAPREHGFVLTPIYWESILYTRQPATWFEADPAFEAQIMGNLNNFVRYTSQHPIRYVLLPSQDPSIDPEIYNYLDQYATILSQAQWTLWALP
ncbi:MAG: glycosyl transferase [Oscillochloridaceae bacterium umkhey_bin13]